MQSTKDAHRATATRAAARRENSISRTVSCFGFPCTCSHSISNLARAIPDILV
ncbi:hypothetical protein PN463_17475 [Dolichospermum circinale CS-537/03]|uniref:hypothetical protein n=1 Tax=Dolichospermum circinale TaxID=109265 RepID=UPI0012DEF2F4|nr:hypothetical protein [Dolichospermum circinale]MDB9480394.1 hypothetical protein [Dolichospermum circinale CS-537/03]MDB9483660.1 hypothetical protein [Dolichospermum circinale CS-537/05]